MLRITWKQINDNSFRGALIALNNNRRLDGKNAYRVGRICSTAQKEMEKAAKLEKEIRDKYAVLKDGEPQRDAEGQVIWNSPTACDEFNKEMDKVLEENVVEVKVLPLDYSAVVSAGAISGLELVAVESLLTGVPEEV